MNACVQCLHLIGVMCLPHAHASTTVYITIISVYISNQVALSKCHDRVYGMHIVYMPYNQVKMSVIKAHNKYASNTSLVLSFIRYVTVHGVKSKRKKF